MSGPDRTNNVEQVSLSNLPPGNVAIQVKPIFIYYLPPPLDHLPPEKGAIQGIPFFSPCLAPKHFIDKSPPPLPPPGVPHIYQLKVLSAAARTA